MPSKEEIELAAKIVADFAGNPDSGIIADLIKDLKKSIAPTPEKRVIESKETR